MIGDLLNNRILIASLAAWFLAGLLKVPIEYITTHKWNWGLWFSTGGMPSSHSALVCATATSVGLYAGFGTPAFAVAWAVAMVVVYDAAGVRRQAGMHARKINIIINEIFTGQPISEEQLKEVLGHTPRQVIAGTIFGIVVAWLIWLAWH
jgi:uncharacterized protein